MTGHIVIIDGAGYQAVNGSELDIDEVIGGANDGDIDGYGRRNVDIDTNDYNVGMMVDAKVVDSARNISAHGGAYAGIKF